MVCIQKLITSIFNTWYRLFSINCYIRTVNSAEKSMQSTNSFFIQHGITEIFNASEIHCTKSNSGVQTTCSENESSLHSECLPDLVHDPELEYLLQNWPVDVQKNRLSTWHADQAACFKNLCNTVQTSTPEKIATELSCRKWGSVPVLISDT